MTDDFKAIIYCMRCHAEVGHETSVVRVCPRRCPECGESPILNPYEGNPFNEERNI